MLDFDDLDEAEAELGVLHRPYSEFMDEHNARIAAGEITGVAPGAPEPDPGAPIDKGFAARKEVVKENHARLMAEGCPSLPPYVKYTSQQVRELAPTMRPGDMYGLPVPATLADLERLGAEWLTQALHAARTLPADNAVTRIVKFKRLATQGKDAAGGSGPKAFLTVEYRKPDPSLHTELFAKMPWSVGDEGKEAGADAFYRWKISCNGDYDGQEVTVYRYLGPLLPFQVPKYYFADMCRSNTNYILITEKIPFGDKDKTEWRPFEVLPVAEKYFDFTLQPRMRREMYFGIQRSQARMAAWDKMNRFSIVPPEVRGSGPNFDPPAVGSFPFPLPVTEKKRKLGRNSAKTTAGLWREFLGDKGKKLYPSEYTEPSFVDALVAMVEEVTPYRDDINAYFCLFPDMVALQHTNLQSDNAYYWYTDDDQIDCGIIDWGGASTRQFTSVMGGSITSAEGDVLDEHEDGLLRCFIDEYYKECGIRLDFEEFRRQWWLMYCLYVSGIGVQIEMEIFRETPREEWSTISSLDDPRVVGVWNVRCYCFMIEKALSYLHRRFTRREGGDPTKLHVHNAFVEWKTYWEKKGMT